MGYRTDYKDAAGAMSNFLRSHGMGPGTVAHQLYMKFIESDPTAKQMNMIRRFAIEVVATVQKSTAKATKETILKAVKSANANLDGSK
jgi:hypothetical protein